MKAHGSRHHHHLGHRRRRAVLDRSGLADHPLDRHGKTLRKDIEQGHALDPELIDRFDKVAEPDAIDQRIGFVLVAAALALLAAGIIQGDVETLRNMATAAMFPLFVGSALLIRLQIARRRRAEP